MNEQSASRPRKKSSPNVLFLVLGWTMLSACVFGLVRFGIGAFLVSNLEPEKHAELRTGAAYIRHAPIVAGITAAICWFVLALLNRRQQPGVAKGVLLGSLTATLSYVGIAVYESIVLISLERELPELLFAAVFGFIGCGIGSAMYSGMFVFPTLILIGGAIGYAERAFGSYSNKTPQTPFVR